MRPSSTVHLALLVALGTLAFHGVAVAGGLQVSPTKLHLSKKVKTGTLTLSNDGTTALRFQVSAYRWTQSAQGEITLAPTSDVVVYPSLFTLAAGKQRSVRIGIDAAAGKTETAYRIIFEPLPPLDQIATEGPTIQVLTRLSLPVFVRPAKLVTKAAVRGLELRDGRVSFAIANTGTTYFVLGQIRIVGRDSTGDAVVDQSISGWYVLAGDSWRTAVDLGAAACNRTTRLEVEATAGKQSWREAIDVSASDCAP